MVIVRYGLVSPKLRSSEGGRDSGLGAGGASPTREIDDENSPVCAATACVPFKRGKMGADYQFVSRALTAARSSSRPTVPAVNSIHLEMVSSTGGRSNPSRRSAANFRSAPGVPFDRS